MWPQTYEERLASWVELRESASQLELQDFLERVNNWRLRAPLNNRYLHWDDQHRWPDPWQLLADNIYCERARALGMLYTIARAWKTGMGDVNIARDCEGDDLVLINQGKYILNWDLDDILNISLANFQVINYLEEETISNILGFKE